IAIGSGVIGLLVLGLIVAYLPSADITLVTQASSFTQTTNVPLPQAAPITSRQVSDKQQTNGSFAVTGTKVTQAVAATGTVVLSNKNCNLGSLRIPSGTHYYASQIAFVQNADITVPDGKSVSASITATSPGVASNLPPNSITSTDDQPLEALVTVGNCFSFTNTAPTTGGVDQRTDPQISQDDLDKARASLTTKVQALIQTDLARQTKPGEALSNQVAYQAPDFLPDHNLGDLVSSFNSSLSLTGQGSFYQTADVQKAFNDNLVAQAQAQHPDQSLVPGHLAATYQETTASGGALTFQGSATGYLAPQLDEQKIRSKLAGKSIEGARAYLTTLPISQASITQSAFHLPNLPLFSSRITIKYQIDQA
ncbi:MAG TPA: baseplate J/gp47 family protein, partial [Candidatus Dormibacteraeota bacterium]|nr:baseplate J/gp47 family protein [Candidatus Dormibacteraeota bacterium]